MDMFIGKNGIITTNNAIEESQYGKQSSIYKSINNNILAGRLNIITTKDGTVSSLNTIASITGPQLVELKGKVLCMSYEVACNGARYSTEQGQTAWQYNRYGIHGTCTIDSSTYYPFANYLNYSGTATRVVQTWQIPTTGTTYGQLAFAVQNFDKPASTNNEIWFLRNLKIEISDHASPYTISNLDVSGDCVSSSEFIEL